MVALKHPVLDLLPFQNLALRDGFPLAEVRLTTQPLLDPIERAATAFRHFTTDFRLGAALDCAMRLA